MAADRGIMDYVPLINLGATFVAVVGAGFLLKFAIAAFQASVSEMKCELKDLSESMKEEFRRFGDKLASISDRVVALETVSAMLGRKPHT